MGVTKTNLFSRKQNELATIAKGFAHPARIAIIQHLLSSNRCVNGELVQELGLAQATISQHLRELKNIGIIQGNIEGVSISYCLNPDKWNEISRLFNDMFDQVSKIESDDCC